MNQSIFKKGDTVKSISRQCYDTFGDVTLKVEGMDTDDDDNPIVVCSIKVGVFLRPDQVYHHTPEVK